MITKKQQSRRRFLRNLALASAGSGLVGGQGRLSLMQSALAASGDYANLSNHKSLVCVYLYGGNDGFNMVVPTNTDGYAQYQSVRGSLALSQNSLLPMTNDAYGFHPSMSNTHALYNAGKLGVVGNVGTLIQPTTRQEILSGNANLPRELFSHSHQTEMWQTSQQPLDGITQNGWGGLMADLLEEANSNPLVQPAFTVFGHNNWQAGRFTNQFALNSNNGAERFLFLGNNTWPSSEQSRTAAWDRILSQSNSNHLVNEAASSFSQARDQIAAVAEGLEQAPDVTTTYNSDNYFANQLKVVADMIAVREILGMKRQIFFVAIGNWDSHGNQLQDHARNLSTLDEGLGSFNGHMEELGLQDSVVSFTMSEFGRTLTVNGDGTDHAWGSHALVMGGPVAGNTIHGTMPQLEIGGSDDSGNSGRLIPTTSLDQYAATFAQWMGVNTGDIAELFPRLGNFSNSTLDFLG